LSPANVCLSYDGEVKVIDFGASQSTLKEQQTAPRVVIGNLTYMSPEQARKKFVDRRADVYSAGVLLWELITWRQLPLKGEPLERWRRAAYPKWDPPSKVRSGVPPAVDALVLRALATEPEKRFPDAVALGTELARLKAKLAPKVGDSDVARLMRTMFSEEKAQEDAVLEELLGKQPSRKLTTKAIPAKLAPPTALAFEHNALEASEDYVPSEETPDAEETPSEKPSPMPRHKTREAHVSFGLDVEGEQDVGMVEARRTTLAREIEGEEEPPQPETDETGWRRLGWLAVGLFLAACAAGFGVVWLLGRG
jgi:serine/threonine-protein kinase